MKWYSKLVILAVLLLMSGCSIKIGTVVLDNGGEPAAKSEIQEETTVIPDTRVSGLPGI